MLPFSTILFVDGNPIGYKVFKNDPDRVSLNPAENPTRNVQPPIINVIKVNGQWKVEGTTNPNLIAQVLEEINLNSELPTHGLSAAP